MLHEKGFLRRYGETDMAKAPVQRAKVSELAGINMNTIYKFSVCEETNENVNKAEPENVAYVHGA